MAWDGWGWGYGASESISDTFCFARLYEFDSIPIGFVGRVAVRALHLHGVLVVSVWRDGLIVAAPSKLKTDDGNSVDITEMKKDSQVRFVGGYQLLKICF